MRHAFHTLLIGCALLAAPAAGAGAFARVRTRWTVQTDGPVRGSAAVSGDRIYFGSADGHVYAVRKADGSLLWKVPTGGVIAGAPATDGAIVVAAGRGDHVRAYDAATGASRWSFAMRPDVPADNAWSYYTAPPVIDGDRVLVGSGDGCLYVLALQTGRLRWKFQTADSIRAAPLVAGDTIYLASGDDYVYALSSADGSLEWKYATEAVALQRGLGFMRSDIFTRPSLEQGLLVFGSRDSHVYAVDVATHDERWTFNYDSTWAMSTAVDDDTVYVGWSTNDMICALDLASGAKKWEYKAGAHTYTTALLLGGQAYWGSADGHVYSFDKDTGALRWAYDVGAGVYSSLVHDDDTLYFGADDGRLYALAEAAAPSHKAVYLPDRVPESAAAFVVDSGIAPYLVRSGYERLGSAQELAGFLSARIADGDPSVLVFAFAMIPPETVGEDPAKGPLRAYLEAGGKVVWPWGAPNLHTFDDAGNYLGRDLTIPARLLGVEFLQLEDSGNYYSRATQAGRDWGLPVWLTTTFASLVAGSGVTPLATNEYGNVSGWLKTFHPRHGSGWVSLRTSSFGVLMSEKELALLERIASYTLE